MICNRPLVFVHTCKLGLEGMVSKRKDSRVIETLARLDQEQEPDAAPAARGARARSHAEGGMAASMP